MLKKKTRDVIITEKISKIHKAIKGLTGACSILEPTATYELASAIDAAKRSLTSIHLDLETSDRTDDTYHNIIDKLDTTYALCINVRFPYEKINTNNHIY